MPIRLGSVTVNPPGISSAYLGYDLVYLAKKLITVSGMSPLALVNALAKPIESLVQYGKTTQVSTPTPSAPVDIICNNGVLKIVDDELPSGYRRLESIRFSGNTYYETQEKLYGTDTVTMTIADFVSSGQNLFGCYSGANETNFSMYIYGTSTGQAYWRYGQTLYRPTVGSTTERTITFGAGGTTGFKNDVTYDTVDFETDSTAWIGGLPNSSSAKFSGRIDGNILVSNRLKYIPCEREADGAICYYEAVNGVVLEPHGDAPIAGAYDNTHNHITAVGTPEVLAITAEDEYSGDIVTFETSSARTIPKLTVNVEPVQDLHGYDSPWSSGGGKNLADPNEVYHQYVSISGYYGDDDTNVYRTLKVSSLKAGRYTFSTNLTGAYITRYRYIYEGSVSMANVGSTRSSLTFTLSNDVTDFGIAFRNKDSTEITEDFWVQIESGSTATSFAPYSNICPISGRTSATVARTGKNLIDSGAYWTDGTVAGVTYSRNADGSIYLSGTSTNNNTYRSIYAPAVRWILPVGQYIASGGTANAQLRINTYKSDGTLISRTQIGETPKTVNVTNDTGYIVVVIGYVNAGTTADDTIYPQLELGSTVSAYEPYAGNTYTITLGDTVYGGTLDVTQGKMTVDRATIVFDGTVGTWYPGGSGVPFLRYNPPTEAKPDYSKRLQVISNQYSVITTGSSTDKAIRITSDNNGIYIYDTRFSSQEVAESVLSETPVEVCYPLLATFEITLTPTQIETLLGTNNVWSDAGPVSAVIERVAKQTASVKNLFSVGDYADTQDVISGAVTRKCATLVLDGTESWEEASTSSVTCYRVAISDAMGGTARSEILSTHFSYASSGQPVGGAFLSTKYLCIIPDQSISTVEAFTASLAEQYANGTPVIVVYPLAEEITEQVAEQQLSTTEGTNIVSVTSDVAPVELSVEAWFASN